MKSKTTRPLFRVRGGIAFILISLLSLTVVHAQDCTAVAADGVQDTDIPAHQWKVELYQGFFGVQGALTPGYVNSYSEHLDHVSGGGDPSAFGTPVLREEAYTDLAALPFAFADETIQTSDNPLDSGFFDSRADIGTGFNPAVANGGWQMIITRTATVDNTITIGLPGSYIDDHVELFVDGTLVDDIIGFRSSLDPADVISYTTTPGEVIEIRLTNREGRGGFNLYIDSPSLDRDNNSVPDACQTDDFDTDGVPDSADLDDDNDGILDTVECTGNTSTANMTGDITDSDTGSYPLSITGNGISGGPTSGGVFLTDVTISTTLNGGDVYESCEFIIVADDFDDGFQASVDATQILYFDQSNWDNTLGAATTEFNAGGLFDIDANDLWTPWTGEGNPQLVLRSNGEVSLMVDTKAPGVRLNALRYMDTASTGWILDTSFSFDCLAGANIVFGNANDNGVGSVGQITNTVVTANIYVCPDEDGNGVSNGRDNDSDGDGCPDALEAVGSYAQSDLDGNDRFTGGVDATGIPSVTSGGQTTTPAVTDSSDATACPIPAPDNDMDDVPDSVDLDDDNDGIPDNIECPSILIDFDFETPGFATPTVNGNNLVNPAGTPYGSWEITGTGGYNMINVDGTSYGFGPDTAQSGDYYVDVFDGDGDISQSFVAPVTASYTFGGYFSNRANDTSTAPRPDFVPWTAVVNILDNTNTSIATSNSFLFDTTVDDEDWYFLEGTVSLTAGETYTLVASVGNFGHFDTGLLKSAPLCDTDNDGITNDLDLDSDNDGIYDVIEAGGTDANNDGRADDDDDNMDNTASDGFPTSAGTGIAPIETTSGTPDYLNLDSDGDGCSDANEAYNNSNADGGDTGIYGLDPATLGTNGLVSAAAYDTGSVAAVTDAGVATGCIPSTVDTDNDGINDDVDLDDDNDGILDTVEGIGDTDGDGVIDSLDLDSDNDGIPDISEAGGVDIDGDGQIDYPTPGDPMSMVDTNDDGLDDGVAANPLPDEDSDDDGLKDRLDIDSDDDGIVDNIEGQSTADYIPPLNLDSDNDGLDDAYDTATGATGIDPVQTGSNGPDYLVRDTDGDGIDDIIEGWDVDADGTPEITPSGTDADNDGLDDAFDNDDATSDPTNGQVPTDFPDAQIPGGDRDWREPLDSDGDGVINTQEVTDGTDPDDPCDFLIASISVEQTGDYMMADCDGDGVQNSVEIRDGTNPEDPCDFVPANVSFEPSGDYLISDCDGDGVTNGTELTDGTDPSDPCSFNEPSVTLEQTENYLTADCDGDTIPNGQEITDGTNPNDPCSSRGGVPPSDITCDIIISNELVGPQVDAGFFRIGNIEAFPDNTVRVYNRWGILVYETTGYDNGNNNFRGISEGRATISEEKALPVGVYFYIVDFMKNGTNTTRSGYLYVNR